MQAWIPVHCGDHWPTMFVLSCLHRKLTSHCHLVSIFEAGRQLSFCVYLCANTQPEDPWSSDYFSLSFCCNLCPVPMLSTESRLPIRSREPKESGFWSVSGNCFQWFLSLPFQHQWVLWACLRDPQAPVGVSAAPSCCLPAPLPLPCSALCGRGRVPY